MARRWLVWVASVTAVTLGAGAAFGCGDPPDASTDSDGRPPASEHPRDEEIVATLDALWVAVGIDTSLLTMGEYGYQFAPDSTSCTELDYDDRWLGFRGSLLPGNVIAQQGLESAITGFLEAEGFTVDRYRSTHPESSVRAVRGVRGELVVEAILSGNGAADVSVQSGPCAPTFGGFDPDLYQLEG